MTATIDVQTMLNRLYDELANEWAAHERNPHTPAKPFDCADCMDYSKAMGKLVRAMETFQ